MIIPGLKKVDRRLAQIGSCLIGLYQFTLSPDKGLPSFWLKGRVCAHKPHCSAYVRSCFERYGFVRGMHYGMERVSQCLPSAEKVYDPPFFKVVFASSAAIGTPYLDLLQDDPRFEVTGIITMPDAPSGRGMKVRPNIIKTHALSRGFTPEQIMTPQSVKLTSKKWGQAAEELHSWLGEQAPDFLVVIAYGKIIPQSLLDIPTIAPINVHGSLLPAYRGASPIQSVFLDEQSVSGVTIMQMEAGLDTGPILKLHEIPLPFDRTARDLITALKEQGPAVLAETLWLYGKGHLSPTPQDETAATHCSKIDKSQGEIDLWSTPLREVYSKYRAFALWPKVYFFYTGMRVIVERLELDQDAYEEDPDSPLLGTDHQLHPAVRTLYVKPAGKAMISREEFVRGYTKKEKDIK